MVGTINESIKGAASLRRYGITFDGNIDVMYISKKLTYLREFVMKLLISISNNSILPILQILFSFFRNSFAVWMKVFVCKSAEIPIRKILHSRYNGFKDFMKSKLNLQNYQHSISRKSFGKPYL